MNVVFSCFIFVLYGIILACVVYVFYAGCKKCKKNRKTKNDVMYFSARGTRSDILCYIVSARGTCSSIIVLYYLHMKCALTLLYYIFRAWNAL